MNEFDNLVPTLSENIEYNRLSDNEYILSNTRDRHYIKINKDVYNILSLVDGKKDLQTISTEYNTQFYKIISIEKLHRLLYKELVPFGILQGFDEQIKAYKKPPYLNISFTIINEKILKRIVPHFYFLFHKKVAWGTLLATSLFLSITLFLKFDLYKTFNAQSCFAYFIVLMALSVTFHEIGHATAASYFGANHGGIGGGFYLFNPVYYADVTDIWRLKKGQRIIVSLAGIYFELIFSSIILLIGLFSNSYMLTIISLIIAISSLFNLNPFMRSDGFWVVSDLINMPNLFQHSYRKIKEILQWIFLRKSIKWIWTDSILIIYGLVSYTFMGMFLYYVIIKNPASIIYFPQRLFELFKDLINGGEFSTSKLIELIFPFMFYFLVFNILKSNIKKLLIHYKKEKSAKY